MDISWLMAGPLPPRMPRQTVLYQRLRAAILGGRLLPGARLPSSRQLAADLGMARNSVLHAYEQLVAEGCLTTTRGGTRVSDLHTNRRAASVGVDSLPPLARRAELTLPPGFAAAVGTGAFDPGVPDLYAFPMRAWRASLDRAWRKATPRQLGYASPGGEPALRRTLAEYLASARGFNVHPDQVIVTAGTQAALDLAVRVLADGGDMAWVENPGYRAAYAVLEMAGLTMRGIPVDGEGMAPTAADWRDSPPRLILVSPAHQYPTGIEMSLQRRLGLLEVAGQTRTWIIEDDYDSEFAAVGRMPPTLFELGGASGPVVFTGTFSKTMYPGMRVGYLVVPGGLAGRFAQISSSLARPGQGIEQLALADFLERGHFTRHLRRMRQRYQTRRTALRQAIGRHLPGFEVTGGDAGIHMCVWFPPSLQDSAVSEAASRLGIRVRPLSSYVLSPANANGLILGFGCVDDGQIDGALVRLRCAIQTLGYEFPDSGLAS